MIRAALVIFVGALLAGCGGGDSRPVALVASSLRPALNDTGPEVRSSFESSGAIAAKIRQGVDADVVVVADPQILTELTRESLVESPTMIARNAIAVLVPRGNPLGIRALADLARPGRRVAVAAATVPLGAYTRTVLARADEEGVLDNVVSQEPDASAMVGRVAQGEVDAGLGYASDLASGRVEGFVLPEAVQVDVRYQAALVRASGRRTAAMAYLDWLVGPDGQAALRAAGFAAP
jgi:molybdate transport system substrate-binding protein